MATKEDITDGSFVGGTGSLYEHRNARRYLRQRLTRRINVVNRNLDSLDIDQCRDDLNLILELRQKISDLDTSIGSFLAPLGEESMDADLDEVERYESISNPIVNILKSKIASLEGISSTSHASLHQPAVSDFPSPNKLKLPEIPLPKFENNENESLIQFFINFENIIRKYNLTDYEKFVFLVRQLANEPLTLVRSLTGIQQSYVEAKEILTKAFARPFKQKLKAIIQLKNLAFDTRDPFKFVGDVNLIVSSFKDHKIDIDTVIQCFVWTKIPQLGPIPNSASPYN